MVAREWSGGGGGGGNPQSLRATKEMHSLKGSRKQCIQWALITAGGKSGSHGPFAWT